MQLDWSTLLLEVINFLVLVWILKRFLYKPVLNVIAQRKAAIDKTLSDAAVLQRDAKELEQKYQSRLADWESEKDDLRIELNQELEVQRERLTTELQNALAQQREKQTVLAQRRLSELEAQAVHEGTQQGLQFTSRLLERFAGAEMEARVVQLALDDLPHLSEVQREALRSVGRESQRVMKVTSAFPLAPAQREAVAEALRGATRPDVMCTFHEDPSLLAGVRISFGPWILRANLQDELAFFAERSCDGS
jgi:F-type H+-transporting ATPase subunit b